MNIYIIYFIGAMVCLFLSFLIIKYYNNGKGSIHSYLKVIAIIVAILFFACGIFLVNLSAEHYWKVCLLDLFDNLSCTFLGVLLAFIYKNNLLRIEKPHSANED